MQAIYEQLLDKMDTLGKGYPRTEKGSEVTYLKKLFSEEDAAFYINMRPGLHTVEETAAYMGISVEEARENLERMGHRHLLFWRYGPGDVQKRYRVIPFVHGLWEFNVDKIELQDVVDRVHHFSNGFGETLFDYRLPIVRAVSTRPEAVKDNGMLRIDDVRENIKQQNLIVVADCVCRTTGKFGSPCDCANTMNRCMMFGDMARYYIEENVAGTRILTVQEALDIMDENDELGHVTMVGHSLNYCAICSCPPCHCAILKAAKLSVALGPKHGKQCFDRWGNYLCTTEQEKCVGCGICVERCPMQALSMGDDGKVVLNRALCIGCGLCATKCPSGAVMLERKPLNELNIPEDEADFDYFDRMAIEKKIVDEERRVLAQVGTE